MIDRAAAALAATLLAATLVAGCVSDQPALPAPKADLHEAARLNTQLGIAYLNEGNMAVAQEKLNRAVEQDSNYAPAHAALGLFYAQRGNLDEAEKSYRTALSLDDQSADIRNAVGAFLCNRGKTQEGLGDLLIAARNLQYPTPEVAWTNAGICAKSAQRGDEAEQYFRAALQANPNYADALLQSADLSFTKKDFKTARAFLQRYERVGPPVPEALLLGARVNRQLGDPQDAHDYEVKLLQKFPNSDQARELLKRSN
jgi:type IV pilus assembly protein PilF